MLLQGSSLHLNIYYISEGFIVILLFLPFFVGKAQKNNGILPPALVGQITCRVVSMETSVSPEKGLRLGPGGQPLIDWSLECKTNDDTPEPD